MRALGLLLIVPLYALFFYAFWTIILRVIAAFGWGRLAQRYRATAEPASDARRLSWNTLNVGSRFAGPSYRGCINAWLDRTGLFLGPGRIFRAGHPMLFLPWSAMRSVVEEGSWIPRTRVELAGDVPPIIFYGTLGTAVADDWRDYGAAKGTT